MARGFAASKTKKEFLEKLGLVEGDIRHEEIFRKMLEEATAGRQRISHPSCLGEASQNNPDVKPPYTYNQIMESVRHQEIINIFRNASDITRPFYVMGSYYNGGNEENWVVRWCLYHSFRYTDNRNRRTNRREGGETLQFPSASSASTPGRGGWPDDNLDSESPLSPGPGEAASSLRAQSLPETRQTENLQSTPAPRSGYYDPARDV